MLKRLCQNITGGTAVEFALVASIISVAALGAFISVGEGSNDQFDTMLTEYENANSK